MRPQTLTLATTIALSCLASDNLWAQTFAPATFYMWADYPQPDPGQSIYHPSSPQSRKMFRMNLKYVPDNQAPFYYESQHRLAVDLANQINAELATGRVDAGSIAVLIQNFAWDASECDSAQGLPEPLFADSNGRSTRMFQPGLIANDDPADLSGGDRLPGLDEYDPNRFPQPRSAFGSSSDQREARSYRHPFIKNALPDAGQTVRAPLRAWMKVLVNEIDAEYQYRLTNQVVGDEIPNPATWRWYMDCEPIFAIPTSGNGIFKLKWLADPCSITGGSCPTAYWSNPRYLLPPAPEFYDATLGRGRTLAEQYEHDRPGDLPPNPLPNPASVLLQGVFNGSEDAANRAIMTWWYQLMQRVQDWVMYNCCYSVLQSKWPNIKCGNYNDFGTDGSLDRFGWFDQRVWTGSLASTNGNQPLPAPNWEPKETFPRWALSARGGGLYFFRDPADNNQYPAQYMAFGTRASGTVHSPLCYPITGYALYGIDAQPDGSYIDPITNTAVTYSWLDGGPTPGWSRRNPYRLGQGVEENESDIDTSVRVHRHNIEATLNSWHSQVAPWALMTATGDQSSSPSRLVYFASEDNSRRLYSMFRSKNLSEVLLWTNWWNHADDPRYEEDLRAAWDQTQETIRRVYSPRVTKYTRSFGILKPYADSAESLDARNSRLEFTVRVNGADREVEQEAKAVTTTGTLPVQDGLQRFSPALASVLPEISG